MLQPVGGIYQGKTYSLTGGVVLEDNFTPPLNHFLLDFDRTRGGRVNGDLHGADVIGGSHLLRQFQHPVEHDWHPLAVGNAVLLNQLQGQFGFKLLHHHRGAAVVQHHHVVMQRGGVVKRSRRQVYGLIAKTKHHANCGRYRGRRVHIGVVATDKHALGLPRGAGGIQHRNPVALVVYRRIRLRVNGLLPGLKAGFDAADHKEVIDTCGLCQQFLCDVRQRQRPDKGFGATVFQNVCGFAFLQMSADWGKNQAAALRSPDDLQELAIVLQHHANVVTRFQAQ